MAKQKVFTSAVILMPPAPMWPPIQAIREKHDKAFARWSFQLYSLPLPTALFQLARTLDYFPPCLVTIFLFFHFISILIV